MVVKSFEKDGVTVFQVDGEINISTSPELKKQYEKLSAKKLVVDLEKVNYIDSSGLATLVEILKKTKSQGGSLGLAGMSEKVRSLFEITKLDKLFSIFPSQQEAVTRVK
ncbi:MAG TPA: STAS domain-containing protein [Candidatus Eisenbacteria bacterium]|nr:STAS domain-containing protein [Candidatus Eisenbacteria bacterium]